jgi:uncharacterized repeat protein (TIGR02543 family)
MNQSTSFAQVATNLLNVLQGYSKTIRFLLVMFLTLTVSTNAWGADVTINVANDTWTNTGTSGTGGTTKVSKSGVTVSSDNGYKDGTTAIREYSGGTITVSSSSNITKIVFTSTASGTSNYGPSKISRNSGGGNYSYSGYNGTWTGASSTVTFKCNAQFRWTKIVVTIADAHTVTWTIDPVAGGTLSSTSGTSTTVTPNVAYTYGSPAYTVTPAGKANVSQDGDNFTATPSADCTIQINMVEKTPATISFENMGNPIPTTTGYYVGDTYTLPTTNDYTCGDKTFVGWSTVTIDNSVNKPTSKFYEPGASVTLAATNEFYAVFAKGGGEEVLTSISGGDWSNGVFGGNWITSGTGTYSGNGVKFDGANDYVLSPDISSKNYSELLLKFKSGYNGNKGSVLTFYAYNKDQILLTDDDVTISPKTVVPDVSYTSQNTIYEVSISANEVIGKIMIKMTSKTSNLGMKYCEIFGVSSSFQNYTTECSTPSVTYTVTYALNGGAGTTPKETEKAEGDEFSLAASTGFSKTGYRFIGWNDGITTYAAGAQYTMPAENVTFTAQWAQEFTVTYDANGGTSTCTDNNKYIQGETVTVCANIPTKSNYKFNGWSDGTNTYLQNATFIMPAKNVTLTAQWKTIPKLATPANLEVTNITCTGATLSWNNVANNNGYTLSITNTSSSQTFNSTIAKNVTSGTPTLNPGTTYTWNVIAKGDGTNYTNSEVADGGSFTTNYKITYNVKSGTWTACEDGCVASGYDFTICSTTPTKTGYNFMGWSTADDTEAEYQAGETINNISANITLFAVWEQKTYTVILSENETITTLTPQTSTSYTLPDELTAGSCLDDTKELVGWSTVAIPNPGDKPTSNFYELGETVTLTADQTTFYAVFATVGEGGVGTTEIVKTETFSNQTSHASESNWKQSLTWDATESNIGVEWSTYYGKILANDDYVEIRTYSDKEMGYVWSSQKIKGLKSIQFNGWHVTESDAADMVVSYSKNNDNDWVEIGTHTAGSTSSSQSAVFTIPDAGVNDEYYISIDLSNATCPSSSNKKYRIDNISLTILEGSGTTISYSDYTTTCVKLPDPVLSFATEPANPIVFTDAVCGGNSSKQSVTVVGENLRDVVNVNVTGPYKIARTASTALKDFTTTLTLDKTASGTIHSNYQTVYIISTPPAQSTEPTTGTLIFTTTKGNTLTVNLSTPTVTCTQYTLTLVDRGVSTEQSTKYYAGEMINEAPADPEGVCTDPIHYVFDGWAEKTVAAGATTYTKVTFPYTVSGNTKFYAVYRYVEEGSGDSGDYVKVTDDLDDYSGDYLFVYETGNVAFDGELDELDEIENTIAVTISNNTIESDATTDAAKFTIAKVDGGYSIQSASGYYIGWGGAKNGLNANSSYTVDYLNTISNNTICGKTGYLKFNKTSGQERFRYYQSGQEDIALYRKAASYLYTTSPVCGPHVEITSDKDIYITSGFANGRNTVIAQKKITFAATRLKPSAGGAAPSIKVPAADITLNGSKTDKVKIVDLTQNIVLQDDGITYAGTGEITVSYTPTASNIYEDINVQLRAEHNTGSDVSLDAFTVHARSLPSEFVIVAKSGDKWYALNGDMNINAANPANGQVTLDNDANPTKATYAPCNTIYTFDGLPNTGDRTYVRFQGTDGAWLWASSGSNVGIQNNVLKTTPEGSNKAYNWKLYTEDNITYRFGNANSNRQLTLNGEKFGMYASGVQDIRILPYEAKCLYNYAPSNLKVSVLKGTYVTLTWDAVIGATKYQYSTNGTTWTDAGTEPTVTINDLTGATEYTYYIRAYHEDAGVSQECIDYAEITFTTANCDDVPTNITYTADLNSITVSWTAAAPTATITYNTKEDGTGGGGTINNATSPYRISGGLDKNTTYYIQILADGTCASPIIPVKTEDVEVDIVEWRTDGIIVDINTNEKIGVTLENEVSYGSGSGSLAEDLFFSKYFEGSGSLKMIAIYNGTGKDVDLTDYFIYKGHNGSANFDEDDQDKISYPLSELGVIKQGQEIVLYSWPLNTDAEASVYSCSQTFLHSIANESGQDANPRWILCGKDPTNSITPIYSDAMNFNGDDPLLLYKDGEIIDVFGATDGESPENNVICDGYNENGIYKTRSDESWVAHDVSNMDYGKTAEDFPNGEIPDDVNVNDPTITAYTARVIMFRKNSVTSGANAVTKNTNDFHTFAEEWEVRQVCRISGDGDLTCAAYQELGTFDYSDYYTKYETMGDKQVFDENQRNEDGTVNVEIPNLDKQSCRNIRIKLTNSKDEVLTDLEYKVPIMITTPQGTDGQAFLALQENLATVEIDGNGNPTGDKTNLTLEQVREICKTCDVVVRDNATLTKIADDAANDHPQVRNVYVYENSSLIVPNGTNYTINNLSLRRKEDAVASVSAYPDALKLPESAAAPISLDFRLSAESWHWFTLPYNCNISEVTWVDGSPAQYNVDWFLMTYDGEKRAETQAGGCWKAYTGTTINAGDGFIIAINGNINNPAHTYELRFPMSKEVLAAEGTDKTVAVRAWGVETNIRPNHKGWNLVGNPYLAYYQRNNITNFEGLRLGQLTGPDPQTGYWEQTGDVPYVVVPVGAGWIAYEQVLASETDLLPFTAYFVQVGNDGKHDSSDELSISFDHTKLQLSATPMPASIIQRATSETDVIEPVIVGVSLTNSLGESDKTSLVIDNQFTDEYEMNADFFKWFGDYYKYYTKPVVYSLGADNGKRAFNALSEDLATQPISLGMYAAQAGNYTFTLDRRSDLSKVQEVWLYDATQDKYTNLMQDSYTFNTAKTESAGRFFLSVKMAPKVSTDINNVTDGTIWATTQDHSIFVNGMLSNAQLWIYDATGKLLHTDQTQYYQHTYQVPVSGTYFVRVQNTMQTQTIKVVVE